MGGGCSVDDIKRRTGISDTQLDSRIEEDKLWKLAGLLGNYELYIGTPGFGLNAADEADLKAIALKNKYQHAMVEAFKKWFNVPHPDVGTYRSLIEILIKLRKVSVAESVAELVCGTSVSTYSKVMTNMSNAWKLVIPVIIACIIPLIIYLVGYQSTEGGINQILRDHYKNIMEVDFDLYLHTDMKLNQIPFIVPNVRLADRYQVENTGVKHLLKTITDGTRIAITGRPGVGKSTLARYIAKLWANGESLQQFTTLFHICLGRASEAITDLKRVTNEECHGIIDPKDSEQGVFEFLEKIKPTKGQNILFLMDGFDEYIPNYADEKNELILRLLKKNVLPKSAMIVMSRPRSVDNYKHYFTSEFEVTGFRQSDIEASLLQLEAPLQTSIESYFDTNPNVKKMCHLPLHMTLIISLASLSNKTKQMLSYKMDTETNIFKSFLESTIFYYQKRHGFDDVTLDECFEHQSSKKDSLCFLFISISELAFNASLQDQQAFSSKESKKLSLSPVSLQKLSLFNVKKAYGSVDEFSFSHPTFRDFMSAYHLVLLSISDQQKMIEKYANKSTFRDLIWKFYFGLLGEQKNDTALRSLFQSYVKYGGYELLPTKYYEIDLFPLAYAFETGMKHDKFIELLDYAHIVGPGNNYSLQINVKEPIDVLSFFNLEESNFNANVNFLLMKRSLEWIIIRFIKIQLRINFDPTPDPNELCSSLFWNQVNDSDIKYEKISHVNRYCSQRYNLTAMNLSYVAILELEYFNLTKEAIDPRIVFNVLQASALLKSAVDIKTEMIEYLNATQNSASSLRKNKLLKIIFSNNTHSISEELNDEELSFMQIWNYFDKWYEKTLSNQQYSFNFSELRILKIQHSLLRNYIDIENLSLALKSATKLEVLGLLNIVLEETPPAFLDLFQSLPHLKVLDLSHTGINLDWLAKGFKNMNTLRELKVPGGRALYDKLEEQIPQNETFGSQLMHLKKLEVLELSYMLYDVFEYEIFYGLKSLRHLKRLNLSLNYFSYPLTIFAQNELAQALCLLGKLEFLDLSHNHIEDLSSKLTEALSQIEEVNLSHNCINVPVSELGFFQASGVKTKLKRINLSNNLLCGDDREFQSFLTNFSVSNLQEVNLLNNHIYFSLETNLILKHFSSSKRKGVHVSNYIMKEDLATYAGCVCEFTGFYWNECLNASMSQESSTNWSEVIDLESKFAASDGYHDCFKFLEEFRSLVVNQTCTIH